VEGGDDKAGETGEWDGDGDEKEQRKEATLRAEPVL
jgi:hypothetical protein